MDEFRVCPECGYKRGFHTTYKKEEDKFKVIFICPHCGSAFDLGLVEDRLKELNPKKVDQHGEQCCQDYIHVCMAECINAFPGFAFLQMHTKSSSKAKSKEMVSVYL